MERLAVPIFLQPLPTSTIAASAPTIPAQFGVDAPRVDWFENSRRATLTHRQRCLEVADEFPSFAEDRWGVSPCMGFDAQGEHDYLVQDVQPNLSDRDEWQLGTIAPYAAGSAIMFTPKESVAALRAYRDLKDESGQPLRLARPGRRRLRPGRQLPLPPQTWRRQRQRRRLGLRRQPGHRRRADAVGHRERPHGPHLAPVHATPRRPTSGQSDYS